MVQHSRSLVKAHALIPPNLIQKHTNPLDTENCYPQIKMTVRNWPISWRKIPPLRTYLEPCSKKDGMKKVFVCFSVYFLFCHSHLLSELLQSFFMVAPLIFPEFFFHPPSLDFGFFSSKREKKNIVA